MANLSEKSRNRIHNRLKVAREGLPFIGLGLAVCLLSVFLDFEIAAVVMGGLTLFTAYFFRDPERWCDHAEECVLAPADGKILSVQKLEGSENLLGEPATKVSIFMSIFNVHVNRIPVNGRIAAVRYFPGRFFSANLEKASAQNEHNRITLQTEEKSRIVFVQIAGLIARRIACWVREGDVVKAGQRFGLIRFGSRMDVYLPSHIRVVAGKGQRVKAGESILGYLP
jgi:phosphatidylserine decarboxylase